MICICSSLVPVLGLTGLTDILHWLVFTDMMGLTD